MSATKVTHLRGFTIEILEDGTSFVQTVSGSGRTKVLDLIATGKLSDGFPVGEAAVASIVDWVKNNK